MEQKRAKFRELAEKRVSNALKQYNMGILKLIPSPILGGSGNKEFLAYIKRNVESKVNIIEVCK